jgi:predicted dehydrogenase
LNHVRIAVFGNGFARTVILPCLRQVDGAEIVGISSPGIDRVRATAEEFGIPHVAASHAEILAACRPDLVFIATPPHRHMEMSMDALRAGCHVVCEKPTALSAGESGAMRDAAARDAAATDRPDRVGESPADHARGRLALINHELRFLPARIALRGLVESGALGKIMRAEYTLESPGRRDPGIPWNWWSDRTQGGGALGAIGSHAIDSLRVLLGEVREVSGVVETLIRERVDPATGKLRPVTSDDFFSSTLRFACEAIATVTVSTVESSRSHRILLTGTRASARLGEQGPLEIAEGRDQWKEIEIGDDLPPSSILGIPDTDWARAFLRLARAIVTAIREGSASAPIEVPGATTFDDGHRNQIILDAIRRSSETGARISLF